ncbi:MAG: pyridoxine 5'-phosphate synthase [Planctomycetes bacterium]|nr:pyridoxine 5'-phosphate synthase [Planctomycetota bacterium]
MIELGCNIDHVATVRQARRTWEPCPVQAAHEALAGGADHITFHLREDRRHIQDRDVERLRAEVPARLNFEMAATDEMVAIALRIKPELCMLVPEGRFEVTTEGGLDVAGQEAALAVQVARLREAGILVSVFIDALPHQIDAARRIGAGVCEIHTGPYAHAWHDEGGLGPRANAELDRVALAGRHACDAGLCFNAGHALHYENVKPIAGLTGIRELHIGHAIVSRAVFTGLREAVREMKRLMIEGSAGR